jgi:hypothetical protein
MLFRVSSAHEEGGERVYSVSTQEFLGDESGNVRALRLVDVEFVDGRITEIEGTEREIPAELVLFAMGFTGPEQDGVVAQLGVDLDERGNIVRDASYMSSVPGVFVAGDAGRGQSLIGPGTTTRVCTSVPSTAVTSSRTLPSSMRIWSPVATSPGRPSYVVEQTSASPGTSRVVIVKAAPSSSFSGPAATLPSRILGPCRSAKMPMAWPLSSEARRTIS